MRALLLLTLTVATAACGHEIGTTRVSVLFDPSGMYEIQVVVDGSTLLEKLEGGAAQSESDPRILQASLNRLSADFRRRIKVEFDGNPVQPEVSFSVNPALSSEIRLKGQIQPGARSFAWTYGWTFASYSLTLRSTASGTPVRATEWLEGNQTSTPFALDSLPPAPSRMSVAWRYLTLGFTHIVPLGFDHVLFVVGIYLLSNRARSVLLQVSAFTVAHSLTLGLSLYGLVRLPAHIVEPAIAISIAYVAIENIFLSELRSWRLALVFAFGLLHGLGFAGALEEVGLPRTEFLTALLTFNLGVEAGQLAVIAVAFLAVGWWQANRSWYRARVVIPASATIACMALYWTVERL